MLEGPRLVGHRGVLVGSSGVRPSGMGTRGKGGDGIDPREVGHKVVGPRGVPSGGVDSRRVGPKGVGPREWAVGVGIRVFMGPNVVGPEASKGWSQVDGPQLGGTGSQCGGTQ